jgi:hypothetical protein
VALGGVLYTTGIYFYSVGKKKPVYHVVRVVSRATQAPDIYFYGHCKISPCANTSEDADEIREPHLTLLTSELPNCKEFYLCTYRPTRTLLRYQVREPGAVTSGSFSSFTA